MKITTNRIKNVIVLLTIFLSAIQLNAQTWEIQNVGFQPTGSLPVEISIVDANTVWAVASIGYYTAVTNEFSRTIDGGASWQMGTIPIPPTFTLFDIAGVGANTAYAAVVASPGLSYIYKTTDGGMNWSILDSGLIYNSSSSYLDKLHFWDAASGIAIGDAVNGTFEIYTTSDSGATWVALPASNMPAAMNGEVTENICFDIKGDVIWFGTSKGRIFKSIDRGMNWTVYSTGTVGYTLIAFLSDTVTGIAALNTPSGYIYKKTDDGGLSWSTFTPPTNMFRFPYSIPGSNIFLSRGNWGLLGSSYSTDGGVTWNLIDYGASAAFGNGYHSFEFLDINTGWAGSEINGSIGGIYRWNPGILGVPGETNPSLSLTVFPNPTNGALYIKNFPANAEAELYDINGRKLRTFTGINSGATNEFRMDVSGFGSGIYMLRIASEKNIYTSRVIIN